MIFDSITLVPSVLVFIAMLAWTVTRVKLPRPVEAMVRLSSILAGEDRQKQLNNRLKAANLNISAELFTAGRLAATALFMLAGIAAAFSNIYSGLELTLIAMLAWRVPLQAVAVIENRRKEEISRSFSMMVNQVRIFARAAGLYHALKIVPYALKKGALGRELRILSAELEMLPLDEALINFAVRCGIKEAGNFARIIIIGYRTGADMDRILSNYSQVMQSSRLEKIKRQIKIQPVIMSVLPALMLMLFILMWIIPMYMNIIGRLQTI